MFKIEQKVPYSANYKECVAQSVKDLKSKARPELVSLPNLDDYDEIYLGYPNYCGTMPMAVYTFLEAFDFTGKQFIRSALTREADFQTQSMILKILPKVQP